MYNKILYYAFSKAQSYYHRNLDIEMNNFYAKLTCHCQVSGANMHTWMLIAYLFHTASSLEVFSLIQIDSVS